MKRILVIFTFDISLKAWHDAGLLERELLLYKRLAKEGCKIGFLTYGDKEDLKFKKELGDIDIFPVYSYMKRPGNRTQRALLSLLIPFKLGAVFKDYDIYKMNQMLGAWVGIIAKLLYRKTLIIRCGYEWWKNSLREPKSPMKKFFILVFGYIFELAAYTLCDKIVVSARPNINFLRRVFFQPARKIVYIPNFIDTACFRRLEVDRVYKDRALYVGRLEKGKNLITLFEAVKASSRKIGLDVIGDGDFLATLKLLAYNNGMNIQFLGIVPNNRLPTEINKYPVFIISSYFENNPKALLEAMACERTVIGTDVEGINDLVEDDLSGILVSTDRDGIRRGLEKAFGMQVEERKALGRRARDLVVRDSSVETIFNKEKGLYNGLS